ncbi:MAG: hypothetical protein IT582_03190 [Opitutaceae bacterium]|nr:hypothetical protein [Opitutaceae bacterium]
MSQSPPESSKHGVILHISRRAVVLILAVLLGPWLAVGVYYATNAEQSSRANTPVVRSETETGATRCAPGPWGDLEYVTILTEPPEQQIGARFPNVDHVNWVLVDYTTAQLDALWQSAGLSAAEIATINQSQLRETAGGIITIHAPRDFVFNLSPTARQVIYTALAAFPQNTAQAEPFRFTASAREEWFKESGLKPETIAQVQRLLYQRGNSLLFSDQALVVPTLKSIEESTRLIKTLARKSTMLLKLRITPDTDTDALERYWSFPGSKDIGPLLSSLKRHGHSTTLDIVHLLPRFARARLYTYPAPNDPGVSTYMDCHWTVLNFFNPEPDQRFQDINQVADTFRDYYHPVTGRPRFGDIYLFSLPNGDIIHSCVQIADDIVFTKNGAAANSPWILMKYADVVAFYPTNLPLDVQRFRMNVIRGN